MSSPDVPPGLRAGLKLYTSSTGSGAWLEYERKKNYTNAFIVQGGKVIVELFNVVLPLSNWLFPFARPIDPAWL